MMMETMSRFGGQLSESFCEVPGGCLAIFKPFYLEQIFIDYCGDAK